MLLLDVSNIMYTGASAKAGYIGESGEYKLHSIPYILQKIAAYYSEDKNMVAVFEKIDKMPAMSSGVGYKSGRNRNPLVEWEVAAFKNLLKFINFPILEVDRQESDYVINNYCRLNRDKEDIIILSADQDLASNVRSGKFETKMLSYSSVSYNINKENFKSITGVDYNFMNLKKILTGCTSDKIKAFPGGDRILKSYMKSLESVWRRRYNYNPEVNKPSDFTDENLMPYTQFSYFMQWYEASPYYEPSGKMQLEERRLLIEGPNFDLPEVGKVDWTAYNQLVSIFNANTDSAVKAVKLGKFDMEFYKKVLAVLEETHREKVGMFEGDLEELEEQVSVSDIHNIMGLLESGGDL